MTQEPLPIRLLLLTDTAVSGSGGSERFLRNLMQRLPSDRYAIDLWQLSPSLAADVQIAGTQIPAQVREHHEPVGAIYGPAGLAAWWHLRQKVLAGCYDIVQSHHEKSDLINAMLPRGPSMVQRISNRRDMGFQKTPRLRQAFSRLNGRFDRLVAPSAAILDAVRDQERAPADRLTCIPNGVDADRFKPAAEPARLLQRQALGYGPDDVVVGCLASLSPVKRHVDLLAAFGMLAPRCPQAQLLLIGEGPLRHDIEAQIHALGLAGRVRLMGLCANPQDVLPALDLAVLASSTEGLSNALLEAQACAIPVVVTAVGGNVDLVVPGRNGLLAPALAPQALAQALEQAVMDAAWRAQAGRAARAMVVARYSMEAMASAYDRLYRQLVQQRDANWAARAQPGPQSP